jgi:hypothetical protein
MRRLLTLVVASFAILVLFAGTALAHDCFNPNKPAGAGVNYTITGFGPTGPIFEQTGPGKGIGGFATLEGYDFHTLGNSANNDGLVGNPDDADKACDGKGIDYASACLGG